MLCAAKMQAQASTSSMHAGAGTLTRARLLGLAVAAAVAALLALSSAQAARATSLDSVEPLTPWHKPLVVLPSPPSLNYLAFAQRGVRRAAAWRHDGWFCEYLGCSNGPYPMLTIWGEVPMFESADALQLAHPSGAHRRLVEKYGLASERYWDRGLGGYAPYPGDREPNVQAFFDDNGWLGIAFAEAYEADREHRWLRDAQRAFRFISAEGWDAAGGGGMWWNTSHPYHSGPALASDALLGMLLYGEDHEAWQLEDAKEYVDWANANDNHDERQLYLEQPNKPESVNDYVQAPLIYAQYLLCQDGQGDSYCERAARVAATTAEQSVNATGYKFNYGPQYDAIYMQWMMAYGKATGERYWLRLAEVNAVAAQRHALSGGGLWLSSWWGGPIKDPETHPGMFRTAAATTSLFAWTGYYASASASAG
jgi:Glycosyl hydrolase family 76